MIRRTLSLSLSLLLVCAASAAMAQDATTAPPPAVAHTDVVTDLVKIDSVVGTGREAELGHTVQVHYTGWLHKPMATGGRGKKFDSSRDRGEPLEFVLGAGRVIKGWEQGILGMKVGGRRTLVIPSHLGYGGRGTGDIIKPGADLIFDVVLVGVK